MHTLLEKLNCSWSDDSERVIVTSGIDDKNIFFYPQEVGHFKTFPPYSAEREGLSSFLVSLTISGKGSLSYEDRKFDLRPGDLFFIDCRTLHKYETPAGENWEFLWLHFNGSNTGGYYKFFREQNDSPIADVKEHPQFEQLLCKLIDLNRQPSDTNPILSSRLIVDLLTELLLLNAPSKRPIGSVPQYLTDLVKDIDQHFPEEISLESYAKKYACNKFHLSKEFKKYFNINFKEYLISRRLNAAKELLKYSDHPVSEIAELVGFENVSHFISLFKDRENMTPLNFRRGWQSI